MILAPVTYGCKYHSTSSLAYDLHVLVRHSAARPDCADDVSIHFERNPTAEYHQSLVVGGLKTVERAIGLGRLFEFVGRHLQTGGRVGLVLRDGDAWQPRAVHPVLGDEVPLGVDDRDDRRDLDFVGLLLGRFEQFRRRVERE